MTDITIQLKPKYEIGKKITQKTFCNGELFLENYFIVVDIRATYDFNSQDIQYEYKLKYADKDFDYIYGWMIL